MTGWLFGLLPGVSPIRAVLSALVSPVGRALLLAMVAFGGGWHVRAAHDRSASLVEQTRAVQARVGQLEAEAATTAAIARGARAREIDATTIAEDLQKKVAAYEAELAQAALDKTAARGNGACLLSDADRRRLRRFAAASAGGARPAARPASLIGKAGRRP